MTDTLTQSVEIRAKINDSRHLLVGYAIVFDSPSENMGFIETVAPKALQGIDLSNVFALYNHDFNSVLGKTGKNLSLNIDSKGLYFELELLPSDEHIFELVQQSIINKMSFGFIVDSDTWQDETHRTINKIKELQEISLVPLPAYTDTDIIAKRSLDMTEDKTPEVEETETVDTDKLQKEIDELKKQVKSLQDDSENTEDEDEKEEKDMQTTTPVVDTETRSFIDSLKTMETRAGISTVDSGVLIPKSILETVKTPTDATSLANHVNKVQVQSGMGVLPVLAKNNARLVSTAEMAENPEITGFNLIERDYKLATYRGALALSKEIISDAPNVKELISNYISEAKNATEESGIAGVLKQAKAVTVSDVVELKQAFNTGLSNYKDKMWVVSESFYNAVDSQTDANGRFLLQDSIASASGVTLFGSPIVVVPDTELGADGEAHAFIGSLKSYISVVYKDDVQVAWVRNENFEEVLAVAIRESFILGDESAGKFVTFAPSAK